MFGKKKELAGGNFVKYKGIVLLVDQRPIGNVMSSPPVETARQSGSKEYTLNNISSPVTIRF